MAVSIKFLGGAKTVTGSSHLVTAGRTEVLLDGGLFQGRRDAFYQINTTFHYNPRTINAMVLSH
ncbi:MAG: MBL fold metallo-hydrolase, partial [Candidatus Omnitrophota bacterium]